MFLLSQLNLIPKQRLTEIIQPAVFVKIYNNDDFFIRALYPYTVCSLVVYTVKYVPKFSYNVSFIMTTSTCMKLKLDFEIKDQLLSLLINWPAFIVDLTIRSLVSC